MLTPLVLIPVNDWDVGDRFYTNVMRFLKAEMDDFHTPGTRSSVCVNLIIMREAARKESGLSDSIDRFPIFRYPIDCNFLSYCQVILDRGGRLIFARPRSEGYLARIADPFGNTFEVICDGREDANHGIDPSKWPFFHQIKLASAEAERKARMSGALIFIPVDDRDAAIRFYSHVMDFSTDGFYFYTSRDNSSIPIDLVNVSELERRELGMENIKSRFSIFRYVIERDFLSYCNGIFERGGNFEFACENPGGYFARIIDPFGNTFEVMCDSFDEKDKTIDPFQWIFYKRY